MPTVVLSLMMTVSFDEMCCTLGVVVHPVNFVSITILPWYTKVSAFDSVQTHILIKCKFVVNIYINVLCYDYIHVLPGRFNLRNGTIAQPFLRDIIISCT